MIQDPTDQFIRTISAHCSVSGKDILEIGCGAGRITRDLAGVAARIVATDPDAAALARARRQVRAANVAFMLCENGVPDLPAQSFDMVIYTLSLHHVPAERMIASLQQAAALLRRHGTIVVIEPGDGGSFNEAKRRFGAGSGDEGPQRLAAFRAMKSLPGWLQRQSVSFQTGFLFADEEDFCISKLPGHSDLPEATRNELWAFLERHRTDQGIMLTSERHLYVLARATELNCPWPHHLFRP